MENYNIEEVFLKQEKYLSVTERYFTYRYCLNASGIEGEDQCVLFHSNKICVVTLAPSHPVLAEKKEISKIDFQVSNKIDRSKNKVSGKGKHGGQMLQNNSALCFIECNDGTKYTVSSCVQGKLIEVNENLLLQPTLLSEKYDSDGYIAIVLPNINKSIQQKETLLSHEEYLAAKVKLNK